MALVPAPALPVAEHGHDARVVTMGGENFLGAAGLSMLVKANRFTAREGRRLRLVRNSGMINHALDTVSPASQKATLKALRETRRIIESRNVDASFASVPDGYSRH